MWERLNIHKTSPFPLYNIENVIPNNFCRIKNGQKAKNRVSFYSVTIIKKEKKSNRLQY